MDLSKLAEALGLKKEASQQDVFAAAAKVVDDGLKRKALLEAIEKALPEHGLKLDQGKLVKGQGAPPAVPPSPELLEARRQADAALLEATKLRLSNVTTQMDQLVAEGKVPPAFRDKLSRLLSISGQAQALSLSQDGSKLEQLAVDVVGTLREFLSALPALTGDRLSQLRGGSEQAKKEREALSQKAKEVVARVQPAKS